jgi:hypothetical protein
MPDIDISIQIYLSISRCILIEKYSDANASGNVSINSDFLNLIVKVQHNLFG